MRILVVEDSLFLQKVTQEYLAKLNYQSVVAANGQLALDLLVSDKSFSYILLDWEMPVMDGITFLENYKNTGIIIPVIMMTTVNKPEKIMQALSLGAQEYIMKPFSIDILDEKIKRVVAA
jgi:two-component system, chemotaxis family, chemotaxis protein CheY